MRSKTTHGVVKWILVLGTALMVAEPVVAQNYPTKPVIARLRADIVKAL